MARKAKPGSKDWYWEAEQDKIASDVDLLLIRPGEGDPTEGLECVGLWFLIFNQMARSARRGYLSDPHDDRKPMSAEAVAVLTGRSAAVVSRIMDVIIERGLFSLNDEGILYSRGLVKKEELRRIRSKAGKKGGLRRTVLLKQVLEQNIKQNVSIGVNGSSDLIIAQKPDSEKKPPSSMVGGMGDFAQAKVQAKSEHTEDAPSWLAKKFVFLRGCGNHVGELTRARVVMVDLLAANVTETQIEAELDRKDRMRSEPIWDFQQRLVPAKKCPKTKDQEEIRRQRKEDQDRMFDELTKDARK